jgi:hypothetical protein
VGLSAVAQLRNWIFLGPGLPWYLSNCLKITFRLSKQFHITSHMRRGRSKSHESLTAEQSNEQELKNAGIVQPTSPVAVHPASSSLMATSQLPTSIPTVVELERDLREMQLKLSRLLSQGVIPPLE